MSTTTHVNIVVSDGTRLRARARGLDKTPCGPVPIFIHGWSGSGRYFDVALARADPTMFPSTSVAYDLRGHGESDKPTRGLTVARLAMDLREVVDHFADACPEGVVFVGTSMGCAVIWSYLQLFGDEERLRGVVLVDQAPLQNRRPDWNLGSKGCFDAASYAKLAEAVRADMDAFADGNAEACLVSMEEIEKREPGVLHALKSETLKCDPEALCELMYDHTHQDWRSACANTAVPALVLGGRKSKIFPWEGVARVGELMKNARVKFYENCDHWLYVEEPAEFAADVANFCREVHREAS